MKITNDLLGISFIFGIFFFLDFFGRISLSWFQIQLAFDLHNYYCVVEVVHVVHVVPIGSFQQEKQKQKPKKNPLASSIFAC